MKINYMNCWLRLNEMIRHMCWKVGVNNKKKSQLPKKIKKFTLADSCENGIDLFVNPRRPKSSLWRKTNSKAAILDHTSENNSDWTMCKYLWTPAVHKKCHQLPGSLVRPVHQPLGNQKVQCCYGEKLIAKQLFKKKKKFFH